MQSSLKCMEGFFEIQYFIVRSNFLLKNRGKQRDGDGKKFASVAVRGWKVANRAGLHSTP